MADWRSTPWALLAAAEECLDRKKWDAHMKEIDKIAPNPFQHGREHQHQQIRTIQQKAADKLIWC